MSVEDFTDDLGARKEKQLMRSKTVGILGLFAAVIVVSGMALGQRASSVFAGNNAPANIRQIDWVLLQANVQVSMDFVNAQATLINVPRITFDEREKVILARASVDGDSLEKMPAAEVRHKLLFTVLRAKSAAKQAMPTLSGEWEASDFRMEFRNLSLKAVGKSIHAGSKERDFPLFAEFRNGKLTLN